LNNEPIRTSALPMIHSPSLIFDLLAGLPYLVAP
jgi:hypothetical protein